MSTIRGPKRHEDKSTGVVTWRVFVRESESRMTTHHFHDEADAKKAIKVAKQFASIGTDPIEMRDPDGTLEWSTDALDEMTKKVLAAPNDLNLQTAARTIVALQGARGKMRNTDKLYADFAQLKADVMEVVTARKKGTRSPAGRGLRTQRRNKAAKKTA